NYAQSNFHGIWRYFMTTALQITTSLFSGDGESSRLAHRLVSSLRDEQPDIEVISRDLAADPVPHLDGERFGAFIAKPETRTPMQQAILNYSDALNDELIHGRPRFAKHPIDSGQWGTNCSHTFGLCVQ